MNSKKRLFGIACIALIGFSIIACDAVGLGGGASDGGNPTGGVPSGIHIPGNVRATATSPSEITVSWSGVSGAAGYYVYRAFSASGSYSRAGTVSATSYNDIGLSANTPYYYKVSAYNSSGTESAMSSSVHAETPIADGGDGDNQGGNDTGNNGGGGDTVNGLQYVNAIGGVEITDYTGSAKNVNIPATIDGKAVVSIGYEAFANNQLSSVTIPNSVIYIGDTAFYNNQLTSVTIPNSVIYIGDKAFLLNQLTSVTIPNSVTSIGEHAFDGNQLTSVTIPNSVTSIGYATFANNQLTGVTIPNSVTIIGAGAFANNQLTNVTIPNSVIFIDDYAFSNSQLISVTIPNSVTYLGEGAFIWNPLTSITIGANVTLEYYYDNDPFGEYNFGSVYEANGKSAGTYTRPTDYSSDWVKR